MEKVINIHINILPEGVFLATSDDVQGLVAQGRTVIETIEIIAPSKVNPGQEFPIAVYAKNRDGSVSANISGEFDSRRNLLRGRRSQPKAGT